MTKRKISKQSKLMTQLLMARITMNIWLATFSKYESWTVNKVPMKRWPKEVFKDFKRCEHLTETCLEAIEAIEKTNQ